MNRVTPSWLEQFRRYMTSENITEQSVIDMVKGIKTGETNFMRYGTAFHAILEEPKKYRIDGMPTIRARYRKPQRGPQTVYTCNGIVFDGADVERALQYVNPLGLNEAKSFKKFRLRNGEEIAVTSRVDKINGITVEEYKTKWGEFDISGYPDSLQWRLYTEVFDVQCVRYVIFEMKERDSLSEFADHPAIDLINIHPFELFAYPGIYDECITALEEFLEWVRMRGLEQYLTTSKQGADSVL